MSIKTKIAAFALATVAFTGAIAMTPSQAQAGYKGLGIGLGIATGALIASGAYAHGYGYGYGPVYVNNCRWVTRFNGYAYVKTRVCGYPTYY